MSFDIDIAIDTTDGCVKYTYWYTTVAEDGNTLCDSGTMTDCLGKDDLKIHIGGE